MLARSLSKMYLSNTNYFIFPLDVTFLFLFESLDLFKNRDLGIGANNCLWPLSSFSFTNLYFWLACSTTVNVDHTF